jgi:hypothetical protein
LLCRSRSPFVFKIATTAVHSSCCNSTVFAVYKQADSSDTKKTNVNVHANHKMSKSVEEKCSEVLSAYFHKHPVKEAPVLKPFAPESSALLQPLFNADNTRVVPCDPDQYKAGPFPSLLLYDLENLKCKNTAVYQHIEARKDQAATALYGTSGAGKTRSIFEYLSHNKGFSFLAGGHEKHSGSQDLESIFDPSLL